MLVQELTAQFGARCHFWEKAGIHLMVRLHTQFSDEEIMTRAAKVVVVDVSAIAISQSGWQR